MAVADGGALFVGDVAIRALLFMGYIRAPELPSLDWAQQPETASLLEEVWPFCSESPMQFQFGSAMVCWLGTRLKYGPVYKGKGRLKLLLERALDWSAYAFWKSPVQDNSRGTKRHINNASDDILWNPTLIGPWGQDVKS